MWQGCFFFHYYLATSSTVWAQICTGLSCLLLYAYFEIHQVRRLSLWQLPIVSSVFKCRYWSLKVASIVCVLKLVDKMENNLWNPDDIIILRYWVTLVQSLISQTIIFISNTQSLHYFKMNGITQYEEKINQMFRQHWKKLYLGCIQNKWQFTLRFLH